MTLRRVSAAHGRRGPEAAAMKTTNEKMARAAREKAQELLEETIRADAVEQEQERLTRLVDGDIAKHLREMVDRGNADDVLLLVGAIRDRYERTIASLHGRKQEQALRAVQADAVEA
jgi:hypothetical protein